MRACKASMLFRVVRPGTMSVTNFYHVNYRPMNPDENFSKPCCNVAKDVFFSYEIEFDGARVELHSLNFMSVLPIRITYGNCADYNYKVATSEIRAVEILVDLNGSGTKEDESRFSVSLNVDVSDYLKGVRYSPSSSIERELFPVPASRFGKTLTHYGDSDVTRTDKISFCFNENGEIIRIRTSSGSNHNPLELSDTVLAAIKKGQRKKTIYRSPLSPNVKTLTDLPYGPVIVRQINQTQDGGTVASGIDIFETIKNIVGLVANNLGVVLTRKGIQVQESDTRR